MPICLYALSSLTKHIFNPTVEDINQQVSLFHSDTQPSNLQLIIKKKDHLHTRYFSHVLHVKQWHQQHKYC